MNIIGKILVVISIFPFFFLIGVSIRYVYFQIGIWWCLLFYFILFNIYYRFNLAQWTNRYWMNFIGLVLGPGVYIIWSTLSDTFPIRDFIVLIITQLLFWLGEYFGYLYYKKIGVEDYLKMKYY